MLEVCITRACVYQTCMCVSDVHVCITRACVYHTSMCDTHVHVCITCACVYQTCTCVSHVHVCYIRASCTYHMCIMHVPYVHHARTTRASAAHGRQPKAFLEAPSPWCVCSGQPSADHALRTTQGKAARKHTSPQDCRDGTEAVRQAAMDDGRYQIDISDCMQQWRH